MSVNVNINGSSYTIPNTGEEGWGDNVTNWIVAASSFLLQRTGGSFPLSSEVDFGATAGLRALVYRSKASDVAASGVLRLGNADKISFRNSANSADLQLGVDGSNDLTFNGFSISFPGGIVPATRGGTGQSVYAVGDLLYASTTTALSKLTVGAVNTVLLSNGTLPVYSLITNSNIDAAAAIAYSKLNLVGGIVNADVNSSAAVARTKLASGTAYRILANDASGVLSENAALTPTHVVTVDSNGQLQGVASIAISQGGTGQSTKTPAFNALSPLTTKGDLVAHDGTNNVRQPVGTNGQVLTADSTQPNGVKWAPASASPTPPTHQKFLSGSGTYTTPTNVVYLKVKMVGGGGGGCGGAGGATGADGTDTTFGLHTAGKGLGGVTFSSTGLGGAGGTGTIGSGATGLSADGGSGGPTQSSPPTGISGGGNGGNSALGGGGGGGGNGNNTPQDGQSGSPNTGGGGGGGAGNGGNSTGAGGGAGAYLDILIPSPAATYSYSVGTGGAGSSGTANGADGADGMILVEEYY